MDTKHKVVLNGLRPDVNADEAHQKLAVLFKVSKEQIAQVVSKPGYIVKKDISADMATTYQRAVDAAGGLCVVEQELDFDIALAPPGVATPPMLPPLSSVTPPLPSAVAVTPPPVPTKDVLFEGSVSNLTNLFSIVEGHGEVTRDRCFFDWGKQTFTADKDELARLEEQKHGLGTKLVIEHKDGARIEVQAANQAGLKNALYALADRPYDQVALEAPDVSKVKNGTAWLAAAAPLIASLLIVFLWGSPYYWGTLKVLKLFLFLLSLIYLFMRIDHLMLQKRGYQAGQLGIVPPEQFPLYLFSRAKVFGHKPTYAWAWCGAFGFTLLDWFIL